nr:DyP-type peroxidase [Chondrostereum purpureum]
MRLFSLLPLLHGLLSATATTVKPRRTGSMLINPAAQPDLPPAGSVSSFAEDGVGMKKRKELFYFFSISDSAAFKTRLASDVNPLITSTQSLLDIDTQPVTAVNIAFTQSGLTTLGITDDLNDALFKTGQASDASALGDPGRDNWVKAFDGTGIHGLLILASDETSNIDDQLASLESALGNSIKEVHRLQGAARPGPEEGHEHFGYMDGIGQPALNGFSVDVLPGQALIDAGKFIVGATGDKRRTASWTTDGSFLAFRQLQQLVPEFNKFLSDNALEVEGLTKEEGADLLGARMVGRWKSGAPLMLAPLRDDPTLAAADLNNNFDYTFTDANLPQLTFKNDQSRCPFSAHIRKTRPRADLQDTAHHIIRAGIPYGPEVTDAEASSGTSDISLERGLAFVAYQSDIQQGFHFMQQAWANSVSFVFGKNDTTPGFDPIVGANKGKPRSVSGLDVNNFDRDFTLVTDFVVSRGGEYFFVPSISALLTTFIA